MSDMRPNFQSSIFRNEVVNTISVKNKLGIPITYESVIANVPIQKQGSLLYQVPTTKLYRSTGLLWIPFVSSEDIVITSTGSGVSLVSQGQGPAMSLKSLLVGGTGLTIVPNIGGDTITFTNTGVSSIVSGSSPGASLIASTGTAEDVILRTLVGTSPILVTSTGTDQITVSLDLTSPLLVTSVTTALPLAVGSIPVLSDTTNPDITVKSLVAGTNCALVDNGSYITVNVSGGGSADVTLSSVSAGGSSIVVNGIGPALTVKGLVAGSGIALSNSGNDIVITANVVVAVGVNSIIAGAGIDVSPVGGQGDVTISISTATNIPGCYAYLATPIPNSAPNADVTHPWWGVQWNNDNMFANGIMNVNTEGVYIITWGSCTDSISTSYQLCYNAVTIQAQSQYDNNTTNFGPFPITNGDGTASGALAMYCFVGDAFSMRHDNVTSIFAQARRTDLLGGTYVGATYLPNSLAVTPPGFYARLTAFVNGYPGNVNIVIPGGWTVLWNSGGIWNGDGTATIAATGMYFISWATCLEDTPTTSSLFIAGVRVQSKNGHDDDGQAVNCGSGTFSCAAGSLIALQNTATQDMYSQTRGNSGIEGATYLSVVRVA